MATQTKASVFKGAHSAGIYADMSADGPEIGTLVAIVDRAKNLPNRKTIGKQDPYCAARLGKEAKKTATDVRGGQTPKWDQELRFTVHDSPDYYQLKISIFTDDKRTDLVGDAWVDLKGIIVPGGGQGDVWQTLTCRGKYAGEIRMEITFYDSRPKPEKPVAKPRPQPATVAEKAPAKQQKASLARRPLPSDPVTGEVPKAQAALIPAQPSPQSTPQPPPPQSNAQTQAVPSSTDHYQAQPRTHTKRPSHSQHAPNHFPMQSIEYQTPPPATRPYHQDPYGHSPSPHATQSHMQTHSHTTPPQMEVARRPLRHQEQYEIPPRQYDGREYTLQGPTHHYSPHDPLGHQNSAPPEQFSQALQRELSRQSFSAHMEAAPPPPPAHRSRHNSNGQDHAYSGYDISPQKTPTYGMRHDVLKQEAHRHSMPDYPGRPALRDYDSAPAMSNVGQPQREPFYEQPLTRHHSHEPAFENHYRSLQPTVEDAPESETQPIPIPRRQQPRRSTHDEMFYEQASEQVSVGLSRSPGAAPQYSASPASHVPIYDQRALPPAVSHPHTNGAPPVVHNPVYDQRALPGPADYTHANGYSSAQNMNSDQRALPAPVGYSHQNGSMTTVQQSAFDQRALPAPADYSRDSRTAYSPPDEHYEPQGHELVPASMARQPNYGPPHALPAPFMPGLDPALSQEITNRIYEDRRHDRRYSNQNTYTAPGGRRMIEGPPSYNSAPPTSYNYAQGYAQPAYTQMANEQPTHDQPGYSGNSEPQASYNSRRSVSPNPTPHNYNEQSSRRSVSPLPNPNNQLVKRRSVSPNPNPNSQHQIRRKSVSPAPPQERSSAVPYGPDSYNAFNTGVSPSQEDLRTGLETKIISHDGREIDPSDHLPVESWAPEPEPKKPSPEPTRGRPTPAGAQPMPPSGRRQLRIAARPAQPSASPSPSYGQRSGPYTPQAAGRQRLHKKARNSAHPTASPDNFQDRQSSYQHRGRPHAGAYEHVNENHAPGYGSAPPIPAKVPIMSGGNGGANNSALMEEMSRIDIGAGRSRRHGGY